MSDTIAMEPWLAVIAGEDAAVYAYSVAGAHVSGAARRRALEGLDAHRAHRSLAAAAVSAAGATPPTSAPAFDLPFPVDSPASAKRLMAQVDNALVATYADAAAGSTGADRRRAARAATECAIRAVTWGAAPQAFPQATSPTSGQ